MLTRVLEPEVMDTEEDAHAYDAIDHAGVAELFAIRAAELAPPRAQILDLGTGPGHLAIEVARRLPDVHVVAIDLADAMLVIAARHVSAAGLRHRIELRRADGKRLDMPDRSFDMVMSNSVVHHIPEPLTMFREIARVVRPSGAVLIKDLHRPATEAELARLVATYAANDTPLQRQLFTDSLRAALTVDEVRTLCVEAGLVGVEIVRPSDRHWAVERRGVA